jgi:two-component system, NtrC family, response regulator HupR/HoxA
MSMGALPSVLVVDDKEWSQEALRRALEEDFTVFTAAGAHDGRTVMAHETIQVVLCDQRIPETTGVEFLKEVRERWPETVRLIISGYSEAHDFTVGINEAGIYQYILKPWHPKALLLTTCNSRLSA